MSTSFPLGSMRVRFAGETDVGRTREVNEDHLYLPDVERLCLVADGMGGHASGEVASRVAVDAVVEYFHNTADEAPVTWPFRVDFDHHLAERRLRAAVQLANRRVWEAAGKDEKLRGMGTTMVACLFTDHEVMLAHVGDSRAYRVRDGTIEQLTEDHSLFSDYVKLGRLEAHSASEFPHKNVIVRALGMKPSTRIDLRREPLRQGDLYLLCSDGLPGMVADEDIRAIVAQDSDLDAVAAALIAAANAAGGADNITVALARLEAAN
jgi:PPM family protein phosphatase